MLCYLGSPGGWSHPLQPWVMAPPLELGSSQALNCIQGHFAFFLKDNTCSWLGSPIYEFSACRISPLPGFVVPVPLV